MATFLYEALREPGEIIKGEIDADDQKAAVSGLLHRGYHVVRIEDAARGGRLRLRFGVFGLKRRELTRFTRRLAVLLRSGLPLVQALARMRKHGAEGEWRSVAAGLQARLEDGQTLSEALQTYPQIFDAMYVHLVRAGEAGGTLAETLLRLADTSERRDELRARTRMALVYPGAMMLMGVVTIVILLTFVVPMFSDVFRDTGQILPLPTRILVMLSSVLQAWWWLMLPAALALALVAARLARAERVRRFLDRALLRVPRLGPTLRTAEFASLTRTLGTLLRNGIPIVNALAITTGAIRNSLYRDSNRLLEHAVREGHSLGHAMQTTGLYPDVVIASVGVGEESGTLDDALLQVADELDRDVEREFRVLMTLLEPAMIVFVGAIVGFIVMAMILPIFDLGAVIDTE
jgi:type II secretory pathway component PulF